MKRKRSSGTAVLDIPVSSPPVRPGLVSPRRTVPRHIVRPPYAATGDPGPARAPLVRTAEEIVAMRHAGAVAAEILLAVAPHVRPGVTTDKLDQIVHDETVARNAYPSPLGYRGYPKSVCTSVNEVICHGIPDSRQLQDGDIVNIDVTAYIGGVHGDTSMTFLVGDVDQWSRHLVTETKVAMDAGIAAVAPGAPVNVIGRAIQDHANASGLGVVREFVGHAIGTDFHGRLSIPHYYDRRASTPMEVGMTFTIEPMLTLGSPEMYVWDDDWTAVTDDGRRTAQFEHTILVTPDGPEVLTKTASGVIPADVLG